MQRVRCNKTLDKDIFPCDCCNEPYCTSCSGITSTESTVLQLKSGRVLRFICIKCKYHPLQETFTSQIKSLQELFKNEIHGLHKKMQSQDDKLIDQTILINRLVCEVNELKDQVPNKTYANVVKVTPEVLVVKPKEKQLSTKTKDDLREKIDPKRMAIAVENIKEGREGSVIIRCGNNNTKEKIKETVENELSNNYSVEEGKQKNPKIIIRGVEEEFIDGDNEVIIESLREQNDLNDGDATFTVFAKYKQKGKVNKGNIILTVDAKLKNTICEMEKLNIGWRRCVVHEHFNIVRCFKCARYGHMLVNCKNNTTCFLCSESHLTSSCKANVYKCINCVETNSRFKKSLNVNHSVTDTNCPCYKRILNLEEKKTKQI